MTLSWAESELLEIVRIVAPDDNEDSITRMMKITAVRRLIEADEDKYLELLKREKP